MDVLPKDYLRQLLHFQYCPSSCFSSRWMFRINNCHKWRWLWNQSGHAGVLVWTQGLEQTFIWSIQQPTWSWWLTHWPKNIGIGLEVELDAWLSRMLQRIWGLPPSSIRADDVLVQMLKTSLIPSMLIHSLCHDENKPTRLVNTPDMGFININTLLDDGFEGGGTRFWNRARSEPTAHSANKGWSHSSATCSTEP